MIVILRYVLTVLGVTMEPFKHLLVCTLALFVLVSSQDAGNASVTCKNEKADGASVKDDSYCKFFVQYIKRQDSHPDSRLVERLPAPAVGEPPVRSFALVVDVNSYPHFPDKDDQNLNGAKKDRENLEKFLKEQQFDEIIVLENDDATRSNINYFLETYLNDQLAIYGARSRTVFAFSGHGSPGEGPDDVGALVLSDWPNASDDKGLYPLSDLTPKLKHLASKGYQFVALLGSCYSGGAIPSSPPGGDNNVFPDARGAHAISATTANDLAYAIGTDSGTEFYENLLKGVRSGRADIDYAGWVQTRDDELQFQGGGIVRLGEAMSYVSTALSKLGINPKTGKSFPQLRMGNLESAEGLWGGAFFFLGPPKKEVAFQQTVSTPTRLCNTTGAGQGQFCTIVNLSSTINVPVVSTGSAAKGNGSVMIFRPPDEYQIRGIDISHFNGKIDWQGIARQHIRFTYLKATEGRSLKDELFTQNWDQSRGAGIVHGAYHVFNFCAAAKEQLANIIGIIPNDPSALPIAIDLQWYGSPLQEDQKGCTDRERINKTLNELSQGIRNYYGKTPIIHVSASGVTDLLDGQTTNPIWLKYFRKAPGDYKTEQPRLPGSNPWTIWQVGTQQIREAGGVVDFDVFFGDDRQFTSFIEAGRNEGLIAAEK